MNNKTKYLILFEHFVGVAFLVFGLFSVDMFVFLCGIMLMLSSKIDFVQLTLKKKR